MADHSVTCSMSRSRNCWNNAAMESFFSSLKTERTARKTYPTRDQAKADVFDYIERFYSTKRRHSTTGYISRNAACGFVCCPILLSWRHPRDVCRMRPRAKSKTMECTGPSARHHHRMVGLKSCLKVDKLDMFRRLCSRRP